MSTVTPTFSIFTLRGNEPQARNALLGSAFPVQQPVSLLNSETVSGGLTQNFASVEEQLFATRVRLKLAISQISMHLPQQWREMTFKGVDFLHSLEDWDDDANFVDERSFKSFLRFIIYSAPEIVPGLAVAPNGNLVASWVTDDARAYVEFLPNDAANAIFSRLTNRGPEAISWRGPTASLKQFISEIKISPAFGW